MRQKVSLNDYSRTRMGQETTTKAIGCNRMNFSGWEDLTTIGNEDRLGEWRVEGK